MSLAPFVVRTADPLDEDQELAADLVNGLGLGGGSSAKAQMFKIGFGNTGTYTPVFAGPNALPVDQRFTSTGRDPVRVDVTTDVALAGLAADPARLGAVITNPSTVDMYVGHTANVNKTGGTTGLLLKAGLANGSYQVPANYRGGIWVMRATTTTGYVVIQEV